MKKLLQLGVAGVRNGSTVVGIDEQRVGFVDAAKHRIKTAMLIAALLLVSAPASAQGGQQETFADYTPVALGYSWKYTNAIDPGDFYYEDVLGLIKFGGYAEAYMVGRDSCNHLTAVNDGVTFIALAWTEDCVLVDFDDVDLSSFSDGHLWDLFPGDCCFEVFRLWEYLDDDLTEIYGIDQTLTDVVVWVGYDANNFDTNDHNVILESGGGFPFKAAVTDIQFFQKNVGPLATFDVMARNGQLGDHYEVVASFDCNGNQIPDHTDIETATSDDLNGNDIPDECEDCPWDCEPTPNGDVGINDFLAVLAQWGGPGSCDFDGSGIGINDFLELLANWGSCP